MSHYHFISSLQYSTVQYQQRRGGGGGGVLPDFKFLFSFLCAADHGLDWPLRKKVYFLGLATNTLNMRKNNIGEHHSPRRFAVVRAIIDRPRALRALIITAHASRRRSSSTPTPIITDHDTMVLSYDDWRRLSIRITLCDRRREKTPSITFLVIIFDYFVGWAGYYSTS